MIYNNFINHLIWNSITQYCIVYGLPNGLHHTFHMLKAAVQLRTYRCRHSGMICNSGDYLASHPALLLQWCSEILIMIWSNISSPRLPQFLQLITAFLSPHCIGFLWWYCAMLFWSLALNFTVWGHKCMRGSALHPVITWGLRRVSV